MPQFRQRPTLRAQQLSNNATYAERRLWRLLSWCQIPIGPFICDFLCRVQMLVVELDGGQHRNNARDVERTTFLESQGYQAVRFWNNDVFENLEGVVLTIANALAVGPTLNPLPQAGGAIK